jgi:hypothetical protein
LWSSPYVQAGLCCTNAPSVNQGNLAMNLMAGILLAAGGIWMLWYFKAPETSETTAFTNNVSFIVIPTTILFLLVSGGILITLELV